MSSALFYSLVKDMRNVAKRMCLKCGKNFDSQGYHNRICGKCNEKNSSLSARAQKPDVFVENNHLPSGRLFLN